MRERHLTTELLPCSGVKVLLEATPTAGGGHHKPHLHTNRCARVALQGQASLCSTDEAAADGLPDEHMRHAPAVLSSTHRMAAADRMQAHTAQSSPRASPPDPLSRLVSRSAAAVAPLKPQRPLVQPHGSAEGLLVGRGACVGPCFLKKRGVFDNQLVPHASGQLSECWAAGLYTVTPGTRMYCIIWCVTYGTRYNT